MKDFNKWLELRENTEFKSVSELCKEITNLMILMERNMMKTEEQPSAKEFDALDHAFKELERTSDYIRRLKDHRNFIRDSESAFSGHGGPPAYYYEPPVR